MNYATAQKLVAVPNYTQAAYRPFVPPTAATAASAYTNAYVQPTGIAPVKVCPSDKVLMISFKSIDFCLFQYTLAQPANYYTQAAAYTPRLAYAPSLSATSSTPFVSSLQQSASQAYTAQAANTNGAIQYAASQLYQQPSFAAKYGYSQIPTAPKYFYASS